jgi:hypothetical protein
MNKSAFISSGYSFFCGCIATAILLNVLPVNGQPFKLGAVSEMNCIFEDGYKLPAMQDSLKIFGIRGEVISGQFALQTKSSLSNVTVSVGELKNVNSGRILPAKAVEWSFVGSIPLSKNTPNQPARILVRQAPARFPEYLMAEKQITLKERSCQAIWLTVTIPDDVEAGTYAGKLTVQSLQGERSIPFYVTVYPITLSGTRHLKVTEWYNTDGFEHFHGIHEKYSQAWFAMLRIYAENMAAHRQNVFQVPMEAIDIQKTKTGQLQFDFTRFDQIAQIFWDTKKMDYLETGELTRFGEGEWSSTDIMLRDFSMKNPETGKTETLAGKDVIPGLLSALESHLRQKEWLSRTLFHIKDEPSMHNSMAWREMSSYIHQYAPDLKRIDAIETTNLLDYIEIAVPKLDAFGTWYDSYRSAQQKGTEIWFYTVGIYQGSLYPNKTIDLPVMNSRILHWLNYRFDATGYLHWGWNQWEDNPYQDVGMHIGDGWHVYPVKEGVLNSLRWEEMRNGIQDYECFRMLEDKIRALKDSLGCRAAWIDPKQRGKEIASQVVISLSEHSNDPLVLDKAKKELIREIVDFKTAPRLYVQTNPPENTVLTYHSSVEVYGWTEPGTKIVVNGKELPVNEQGYFLEQIGGDLLDETKVPFSRGEIMVQATNAKGSKKVVREFGVKY